MPLHPRARVLLDMLNRVDAPRLHEQPVALARRNFHKLLFAYRPEPQAVAAVRELTLPRREHAGGALGARLYIPRHADAGALPVLIWLHGGGWTLGDVAAYDSLHRELANDGRCAVLALAYRLSPEHRFPAALDDVMLGWRYLQREAAHLGLDAQRVAIGGDSAGGNLAAVVCLQLRDAGGIQPRLQALVYPATDMRSQRASHQRYGQGHFLDSASIAWFQSNYLESLADWQDWRASPILAPDFSALPPCLLITAECDPLTDDGVAYLEKLAAAGVPVRHCDYAGMVHGFFTMGRIFDAANQAVAEVTLALRGAFAQQAKEG